MPRIILVFIVALVVLGGCRNKVEKETLWETYQEPVKPQSLPNDSGVEEINILWKKDVGEGSETGFAILKPAIYQDGVFVANREGEVSRFDLQSGELIWRTSLDENVYSAVGVNEQTVVVSHDNGNVTALNADGGEILWEAAIKRQISAIPVIGKGRVIVRTADGLVIGLDQRSGDIVWQIQKTVPGLSMHGDSLPVITGDAVLVGLSSGKIIANNVINGRDYWETEISFVRGQNEIERLTDSDTTPIVQGAVVYTAAYQGSIVAVQLQNASTIWKTDISTRLPMAIDKDKLFVTGEFGDIVALNNIDGKVVWEQQAFRGHGVSQPIVLGDRVIIGDSNGKIHTLDPGSGALIETRTVVSGAIAGIVSDDNRFTVFSSEGDIATMSF